MATVPYALVMFMKPHIAMLAEQYDVTLVANGLEKDFSTLLNDNVRFIPVNIVRKVSPWLDMLTLFSLYKVLRKNHFDVVHSLMPKTALLTMLAATFALIPNRIHTFTGQVWANKEGVARFGLKMLDIIVANFATGLIADSESQRQFLISQQVVEKDKIVVLGNGSVCGVDVKRFKPNLYVRNEIRTDLNIPANAIIYLFLGRLNRDKGIQDLAHAFAELADNLPQAHLLMVGPDEGGMDLMLQVILAKCTKQFHRVGFTNEPENYMACADVFCLPSYREGFGSVLIEAASVGLPVIASRIYGITDAVADGETGLLHQPKNIEEIKQALLILTINTNLREKMAKQAMARAHTFFATDILVNEMRKYYQNLCSQPENE